jgi:hypothetical protein
MVFCNEINRSIVAENRAVCRPINQCSNVSVASLPWTIQKVQAKPDAIMRIKYIFIVVKADVLMFLF